MSCTEIYFPNVGIGEWSTNGSGKLFARSEKGGFMWDLQAMARQENVGKILHEKEKMCPYQSMGLESDLADKASELGQFLDSVCPH